MTKTEYNPKTGEIGFRWACSDGSLFALNTNEDRKFLDGELDRETQYADISVDPIEVKPRPSFTAEADKQSIFADGTDVITVTGLPQGDTRVSISGPIGTSWVENRDQITLTVNIPGRYRIRFTQFPYKDSTVEFDAT